MRENPSNSKRTIAARVERQLVADLEQIGAREERSLSYLIQAAIREFVERHKDQAA